LRCVLEARPHIAERLHDLFQARAFLPELLSTHLVAPDVGLFELPRDFRQAFPLAVEVKDTS